MRKVDVPSAEVLQSVLDGLAARISRHATSGKQHAKAEPFGELLRLVARKHEAVPAPLVEVAADALGSSIGRVPDPTRSAESDRTGEQPPADPQAPALPRPEPTLVAITQQEAKFLALRADVAAPAAAAAVAEPLERTAEHLRPSMLAAPVGEARAAPMPTDPLPPQARMAAFARALAPSAQASAGPAPVRLVVLQQETHFEPVPQLAAVQKIADVVVSEMQGLSEIASLRAADIASSGQSSGPGQPLKILTLRLDPPSLGTVMVKLRLVGDAVEVELVVSRRETMHMLQEQRELLGELMRAAGYAARIAQVQHAEPDGSALGAHQQQHAPLPQQAAPSASQSQPDGAGEPWSEARGGAQQEQRERRQSGREQEALRDHDVAASRPGGALYL